MINTKEYKKLWREQNLHVLQSEAWYRVEAEADLYIIGGMPTLVTIKTPKFCKPYASVLRPGHTDFSCSSWATELIKSVAYDHPEISHIHIEPNGEFIDWPSNYIKDDSKPELAQYTCTNDLTQNEDDILANASKSHRQNIRKGLKNGLVTEVFTADDSGFNRFIDIMRSISTSKSFSQYNESRYLKVWKELSADNQAYILIGSHEGKDIGAYLVAHSQTTAWQLYGGRTQKGRDLKLSQALAYKAMIAAKDRGLKTYDMWGVGAFDEHGPIISDELYGIGQFKLSFGGVPYKHGDAMMHIVDKGSYSRFIKVKKLQNIKTRLKKKLS